MEKKLYRSRNDAMLGGVCGGLGEYFGIDANLIRLVFILLCVANGIGLLIYLALWLIVPRKEEAQDTSATKTVHVGMSEIKDKARSLGEEMHTVVRSKHTEAHIFVGVVLVILGIGFLLRNLGIVWFYWLKFDIVWPALLILVGLILLYRRARKD